MPTPLVSPRQRHSRPRRAVTEPTTRAQTRLAGSCPIGPNLLRRPPSSRIGSARSTPLPATGQADNVEAPAISLRKEPRTPAHPIDLAIYTLQHAQGAQCPECEAEMYLLSPRWDFTLPRQESLFGGKTEPIFDTSGQAWFHLCAECGAVYELGVGQLGGRESGR
jgi:hypothetical protein